MNPKISGLFYHSALLFNTGADPGLAARSSLDPTACGSTTLLLRAHVLLPPSWLPVASLAVVPLFFLGDIHAA